MIIPVLALALLAPSPAPAQSFEALAVEIVRGAVPTADELAAAIRGGSREERMAAIARASGMLGGFDAAGQRVVISALRDQAESSSAPGEVRGRAFVVLGEQVLWLKDDMTKREAVGVLLDAVEARNDSREGYRRHALKGLWAAAGRLPRDEALENRVAAAAMAGVQSTDRVERVLSLNVLDDLLRSRPYVAAYHRSGRSLLYAVLDPIAADPNGFCTDGRRDEGERWVSLKVLIALNWAMADSSVRARVRTVMTEVSLSDSNAAIRRQAAIWARAIRP